LHLLKLAATKLNQKLIIRNINPSY